LATREGGSEWEPIKILLKNSAYTPKSLPKNLAHTCQDHIVTTKLLTLGTKRKLAQEEPREKASARHTAAEIVGTTNPKSVLPIWAYWTGSEV
jgi:hypothetical protein